MLSHWMFCGKYVVITRQLKLTIGTFVSKKEKQSYQDLIHMHRKGDLHSTLSF